ncbi:ABC transporter ATP-binding protein [Flaviflexus ciconiae]|uniref:ABC transporter ATP-binding protein n=2 Tax=Flaviflexus TaxID=1522056 RepID=A0A3Q9G2F7_9ACTO|nr:ABC transporter ATP-binding protein [Flaviflexus ciconiae]AZQ77415.1 ABC transporter ATP-binding protein [Flaviflexus ciconiae]
MTDIALQLVDVLKTHDSGAQKVVALDRVDFTLERGELVAIMGPSGSGKSTLLNMAGGLDSPDSGDVIVNGQNLVTMSVADRAEVRRTQIGYVFQDYNLIPTLTVAENVSLPLELDGVKEAVAREQALKGLAELGLESLADRFPAEVSRGQAQRTAIARALLGEGRLLLADEPTGALDSNSSEEVMMLLRDRVDHGATGIIVTHESRYAGWADRVVFLRDGAIVDSTSEA